MEVNEETLQLHAVYKKPYLYYKSLENPYQVLQVMCTAAEHEIKIILVSAQSYSNIDSNKHIQYSFVLW